MRYFDDPRRPNRRRFLQYMAVAAAGGRALLERTPARAAVPVPQATEWPKLPTRTLGRTGFAASRLVFGCGAALSRGRKDELLDAARAAGVNVFDVGHRAYYNDAEKNLAPFLKRERDGVFLISKALLGVDLAADDQVTKEIARTAAATWSRRLDESLGELGVDHVDAYYLMAVNNPGIVESDEILDAFRSARTAGKVRHLGLSCHENQHQVLEAAMRTEAYGLAMVGVTPAGWYDLPSKAPHAEARPMVEMRSFLDRVRASGIGLIGMKAGRYLAGGWVFGWSRPEAFDVHYGEKLRGAGLSPFQRSYAFVLENGVDVVNADMQELAHLHENVIAAATQPSSIEWQAAQNHLHASSDRRLALEDICWAVLNTKEFLFQH